MNWLRQFWTRTGPGIRKEAPRKTGFALLADVIARNWWDLVQLNLLMLLACLPLVTIPAALVAGARICALMLEDKPVYLGRDFLEAFRQRFWKATALGVIATATIALPAYAAFIFLQAARDTIVFALPLAIGASTALFAAIAAAYALTLLALRDQPLGPLLKRALLGGLLRPMPALAAVAVVALLWTLHVLLYPVSVFMPVLINFSFGTLAVIFGVYEAAVRLLAQESAGDGATYAGGSAKSAQ
jgi:uncharacterized membrane protein YesL